MTQYPLGYENPQVLTDKAYWVMAHKRQTTQLSGHGSAKRRPIPDHKSGTIDPSLIRGLVQCQIDVL